MLEENPQNGGIILRPSTLPNNYALTLRQRTARSEILPPPPPPTAFLSVELRTELNGTKIRQGALSLSLSVVTYF